jgi:hypothetical protein
MNTYLPKQIILITMKCISFFIGLIFLYSCDDSFTKNYKNEDTTELQPSIDSLNEKVNSLNRRLLQLEENSSREGFVTKKKEEADTREKKAEEKKISRNVQCKNCNGTGSKQETCDNCNGSGYKYNRNCKSCSEYNTSSQGKGYVYRTCSACNGNRTVIE